MSFPRLPLSAISTDEGQSLIKVVRSIHRHFEIEISLARQVGDQLVDEALARHEPTDAPGHEYGSVLGVWSMPRGKWGEFNSNADDHPDQYERDLNFYDAEPAMLADFDIWAYRLSRKTLFGIRTWRKPKTACAVSALDQHQFGLFDRMVQQWRLSDVYASRRYIKKAVKRGDVQVCRRMFQAVDGKLRFEVDYDRSSALCRAAWFGRLRLCRALLADGADPRYRHSLCLHNAAHRGHIDVCRVLLAAGACPIEGEALCRAVIGQHHELCRWLLDEVYDDDSPSKQIHEALVNAACSTHPDGLELVKLLLERGADAAYDKSDSLVWTARRGRTEMCRLLIEKGGARPRDRNSRCLVVAAENGHVNTCRLLLEHGARPTALDSMCVQEAYFNEHWEVVCLLVEHGAYLPYKNCVGHYPLLRWAIKYGRIQSVLTILRHARLDRSALSDYADLITPKYIEKRFISLAKSGRRPVKRFREHMWEIHRMLLVASGRVTSSEEDEEDVDL